MTGYVEFGKGKCYSAGGSMAKGSGTAEFQAFNGDASAHLPALVIESPCFKQIEQNGVGITVLQAVGIFFINDVPQYEQRFFL